MTNLTKEEYARLHLKAKRGMLTAEERAALEAYEAAAQPAPQTPVPADTETLLCCPYCGHATITTQIVSDVTYRKPATVIAMMFAPLIAVVLAFLLRNMFVTVLAAMFAASQLLAAPLVSVFVGYDPELAAMTLHGFRIYAVAFLVCGFNIYGSAFFTALNNGKVSALISFMRTLVFETSTVMLLPIVWGIDGVWSAIIVAEACALVLTTFFLVYLRKPYGYA